VSLECLYASIYLMGTTHNTYIYIYPNVFVCLYPYIYKRASRHFTDTLEVLYLQLVTTGCVHVLYISALQHSTLSVSD
jgi:hypothetical protein